VSVRGGGDILRLWLLLLLLLVVVVLFHQPAHRKPKISFSLVSFFFFFDS
jgi:hypothetical protein